MKPVTGIELLKGLTLTAIERGNDNLLFIEENGRRFKMYHCQDCCESVDIDDIAGDLKDLLNTPIVTAYESTNETEPAKRPDWVSDGEEYTPESYTWTFYRISTVQGTVTVRWYGTSNGYYSESVSFEEVACLSL